MTLTRNSKADLRAEIDQHLIAGNYTQAQAALQQLWLVERTSATAHYVVSCYERLRPFVNLTPCRVAILRSFTLEPALPLLKAEALLGGIDVTVYIADFDNYAQQILDPSSALYDFQPDTVILAVQTRDIAPKIWEDYTDHAREEMEAYADNLVSTLAEWIRVFRSRIGANLILHTFEKPAYARAGVLDAQCGNGQLTIIQQMNDRLQDLAAEHAGVYVLDYDGLIARRGRENWHDERKWLTMRMPIAAENLPVLTQEWLRFLHPLTGRVAKVVVTDLDNTLWGGVVGEDGIDGIQVDNEYPGAGYRALQRALLDLYNRGILLAISSKNNEEEALEVFRRHPGMLLKLDHFASVQLNWEPKADNLRRIAEELNVGLDSLVFLDDNPTERQSIRMALPEVSVIELPADSTRYAHAVRQHPLFERVASSAEDRERTRYYAEQRQRRDFEKGASSLEEFYQSLAQTVEIARVSKETLGRTEQLIKKTNQFNLTTRRYSEAQIAQFASDPDWNVYTVRVRDCFGDNGTVGVCITHREGTACEVDTLLLSCRVIGRTVETAILSFLVEEGRTRGVTRLEGWFLPTRKNKPAESFYSSNNFKLKETTESGSLWSLDLREAEVRCPPWIRLHVDGEFAAQASASLIEAAATMPSGSAT